MPISQDRLLSLARSAQAYVDYSERCLAFVQSWITQPVAGATAEQILGSIESFMLAHKPGLQLTLPIVQELATFTPAKIKANTQAKLAQQRYRYNKGWRKANAKVYSKLLREADRDSLVREAEANFPSPEAVTPLPITPEHLKALLGDSDEG
jgi:hypothetical protein